MSVVWYELVVREGDVGRKGGGGGGGGGFLNLADPTTAKGCPGLSPSVIGCALCSIPFCELDHL